MQTQTIFTEKHSVFCLYLIKCNLHLFIDKKLFTPGPLGVSKTTKEAMLRDVGSRDSDFIESVKQIRQQLVQIAGIKSRDSQSGTFL